MKFPIIQATFGSVGVSIRMKKTSEQVVDDFRMSSQV